MKSQMISGDSNFYVDSLLQANFDHKGHVVSEVPISSTISRYACRILIDRKEPHRAFLYAAGFDASSNICLGVSYDFSNNI